MKNIKITVNSINYTFECSCRGTRSGFAHDCILRINGVKFINAHLYYMNRTWERYDFQCVCIKAINLKIADCITALKDYYMHGLHDYKKMSKKRSSDFNKYIETFEILNNYKKCRELLETNTY